MVDEEFVCFYDQSFLAQNQLTAANIIDYFSTSQFYDRECLNEILKMQSQFANIDIKHRLTTTPGFYYILEHEADGLFVIAKNEYENQRTTRLKLYYCIHGHIYCAPTTKALSESRLIDSLWYLNEALDRYEEQKRFDWLEGFRYREEKKSQGGDDKEMKFVLETLHDLERMV